MRTYDNVGGIVAHFLNAHDVLTFFLSYNLQIAGLLV